MAQPLLWQVFGKYCWETTGNRTPTLLHESIRLRGIRANVFPAFPCSELFTRGWSLVRSQPRPFTPQQPCGFRSTMGCSVCETCDTCGAVPPPVPPRR